MGSISIRGIDENLAALLKEAASLEHKSVNQLVLETLKKKAGLEKERRFTQEWHELDSLFGRWSEEEFSQIQGHQCVTIPKPAIQTIWIS